MGGKATEAWGTVRISKAVYDKVEQVFQDFFINLKEDLGDVKNQEGGLNNLTKINQNQEIKNNIDDIMLAIPLSYQNKDSFGDVDVLSTLPVSFLLKKLHQHPSFTIQPDFLKDRLNEKTGEINVNEAITNVPIKVKFIDEQGKKQESDYFQLDLIHVKKEDFDCTYNYYCFNDLGNMVGRIAHFLGLKFGQNGLSLSFPEDHKYRLALGNEANLFLSKDYFKILDLLGFDVPENKNDYYNMFKDKQDIFNFVMKSKNFTPYAFLSIFKKSKSKIRDRKRQTLNDFVDGMVKDGLLTPFEAYEATADDISFKRLNGFDTIKEFTKQGFKPDVPYTVQLKNIGLKVSRKHYHQLYQGVFNGELIVSNLKELDNVNFEKINQDPKIKGKFINLIKQEIDKQLKEENLGMKEVISMPKEQVKERIIHVINQNKDIFFSSLQKHSSNKMENHIDKKVNDVLNSKQKPVI